MNLTLAIPVVAACASFMFAPERLSGQAHTKCRPADATTSNVIGDLERWITSTEPDDILARDSVFRIPVVDLDQISVVTDEGVCAKAINGYAALAGNRTPKSLYVIRMGPDFFALHDPTILAGDLSIVIITDSEFRPIGGWTGA